MAAGDAEAWGRQVTWPRVGSGTPCGVVPGRPSGTKRVHVAAQVQVGPRGLLCGGGKSVRNALSCKHLKTRGQRLQEAFIFLWNVKWEGRGCWPDSAVQCCQGFRFLLAPASSVASFHPGFGCLMFARWLLLFWQQHPLSIRKQGRRGSSCCFFLLPGK